MQSHFRSDTYKKFLDYVRSEVQKERSVFHRRMFSVFLWCFALPLMALLVIILLVKFNHLPLVFRKYWDWVLLAFPISYTLYFLSSEVLRDIPQAVRKGGLGTLLVGYGRDGEWRERVCDGMKRAVHATPADWEWIVENFRIDLEALQQRNRFLTGLAGAVMFFITEGLDLVFNEGFEPKAIWTRNPLGLMEYSTRDFSQFIGLGLFLMLLYLAGSKAFHSLKRFLHCAELVLTHARSTTSKSV